MAALTTYQNRPNGESSRQEDPWMIFARAMITLAIRDLKGSGESRQAAIDFLLGSGLENMMLLIGFQEPEIVIEAVRERLGKIV